jgi:hypothetical protein
LDAPADDGRALAERARVVLECAAGKPNTVVARELRLTKQTIGKWRSRFLRQRLDGLPIIDCLDADPPLLGPAWPRA